MKKSEKIWIFECELGRTKPRKWASEALKGEELEGIENDMVPHHQKLAFWDLQHALGHQRHYIREIL